MRRAIQERHHHTGVREEKQGPMTEERMGAASDASQSEWRGVRMVAPVASANRASAEDDGSLITIKVNGAKKK